MQEDTQHHWLQFFKVLIYSAFGFSLLAYLFILLLDPYDDVPFSLKMVRPPMDINQRFLYPAIIRSGRYDSIVIGTSTSRLLHPARLDQVLGFKFANLAMNSARAWEQKEVGNLFLKSTPHPKALIVGLDSVWCDQNADINRLTERPFPPWLYDDDPWNDLLYLFNGRTLEIAGRLALNKLGLMSPRLGMDGYERFVPPEEDYDLKRVQQKLRQKEQASTPAYYPSKGFPAMVWLEELLTRMPNGTQKVVVFMPVNHVALPKPLSPLDQLESACKSQAISISKRTHSVLLDFRIPSSLTDNDSHFWDELHHRTYVSDDIIDRIGDVLNKKPRQQSDLFNLYLPD